MLFCYVSNNDLPHTPTTLKVSALLSMRLPESKNIKCGNFFSKKGTFKMQYKIKNILTAATGIRISTNKPASACFISLSFTSKKY